MNEKDQNILGNMWVKLVILLLSVVLFFTICNFLKGILISLFLAFTVAYVFDPVVDILETRKRFLKRIKIPRSLAIFLLLLIITLVTSGVLTYAIPKTVNGIQQVGNTLRKSFPEYRAEIRELIERYGDNELAQFLKSKLGINNNIEGLEDGTEKNTDLLVDQNQVADQNQENVGQKEITAIQDTDKEVEDISPLVNLKKYTPQVFAFVSNITKKIFKSTFGIFGIIINFLIFGVVTIYLLKDFDNITRSAKGLIPLPAHDKTTEIFSKIDVNLKEFFRGQITVCLILSFIYSIGLTIVGVPLAFVLGFVGGFGNVIPYVGTIAGLGLTVIITLVQFHDVQHVLLVLMVFGIGQLLEGTLITPKIIGHKLGLSPVIVIVSILIWSQLLGFLGLLLAVPFTSAAKVLIDEGIIKYRGSTLYKKASWYTSNGKK